MKRIVGFLIVCAVVATGFSHAHAGEKKKGTLMAGRLKFGPYLNTGMESSVTEDLDLEGKTVKRVVIQTAASGGTFDTRVLKCDGSVAVLESLSNLTLYANSKAEQKIIPGVCGSELVIDHTPNHYSEYTIYADVQ